MLILSAVAAAGTATAVTGSSVRDVASHDQAHGAEVSWPAGDGAADPTSPTADAAPRDRPQTLSRSYAREAADPVKKAELAAAGRRITGLLVKHVVIKPEPVRHRAEAHTAVAHAVVTSGDPRTIAGSLLTSFGWSSDQLGCLISLWDRESGWSTYAENPTSGAYGIPQALPGSKMASAGPDWQTNPATQIRWGLGYIRDSYGSPCGAWAHSESSGWY